MPILLVMTAQPLCHMAPQAMKSSAEGRGVRWDSLVREMAELKEVGAVGGELPQS